MKVHFAVELRRPAIPRRQVEQRLQGGVGNPQRLDAIPVDAQQPDGDAMPRVLELAIEVTLHHLAVRKANGNFAIGTSLLRGRRAGSQGNALDRRQWDQRPFIVAALVGQLELEVWLVQADGANPPFDDLVVKKSYGDGGRFSDPGTAHQWPS